LMSGLAFPRLPEPINTRRGLIVWIACDKRKANLSRCFLD
jgi:hypothetical protein